MSKFPYDEKLWKAWIASNTEGAIDSKTAGDFGDFSDQALKDGDFPKALEAADLSIRFDPTLIWTKINRAHAFMFLGRLDEARDAYHEHRGETVPNKGLWEQLVVDDFALLRDQGRRHSLMVEIEDQFKPAIAAARAKK